MSDIVTTNDIFRAVREAEADTAAIERDIAAAVTARADLFDRLPTMRAERTRAARAMLLEAAPRKMWQTALQSEHETQALIADIDSVISILERDLAQARYRIENAKHEARMAGLDQRLRRIATENDFAVPEGAEFLRDVTRAYEWLATVGRTDALDRKHATTYWLDRMSLATRGHVPTLALVAAAMCHGDIAVEMGDHVTSFGITEYGGKPAASLPLNGDPTPSAHRALITKDQQNYRGYQPGYHHGFRAAADFVGRVQ